MAEKSKRKVRAKTSKKGFVLSVGDEGAILTHYDKGTLLNRIFVDSPFSPDIKLMKKLFVLYPKLPIYIYVDVIEQNYILHNLPPVSSMEVKKQAEKKLKRDFQPNDLNNYLALGRDKTGRKDWRYLFISLANTEPFSNWVDIVLEQKNKIGGIYLLPTETQELSKAINSKIGTGKNHLWELLILHNKISGFRIIAFKEGQIYFTRLTQHNIGENIAEVVAGNLEQEITNTVEYLKRLGYSDEEDTHLTIICSEDILKKVDVSRMRFGKVDRLTPFTAADKLGLHFAVKENDRYADILCAAHFLNAKKRHLAFSTKVIKQIVNLQNFKLMAHLAGALFFVITLGFTIDLAMQQPEVMKKHEEAEFKLNNAKLNLQKKVELQNNLPKNIDAMVEIFDYTRRLPNNDNLLLKRLYEAMEGIGDTTKIKKVSIKFADFTPKSGSALSAEQKAAIGTVGGFENQFPNFESNQMPQFGNPGMRGHFGNPNQPETPTDGKRIPDVTIEYPFEGVIEYEFSVKRGELDILRDLSNKFIEKLNKNKRGLVFSFEEEPVFEKNDEIEIVSENEKERLDEMIYLQSQIKFAGKYLEEKKSN